jgi:azurin
MMPMPANNPALRLPTSPAAYENGTPQHASKICGATAQINDNVKHNNAEAMARFLKFTTIPV